VAIETLLSSSEAGDRADGANGELRTTRSYILVVDDEAIVRNFLARCLEAEGYAVKQADGAAEALEVMMSESVAVVLCDIRMPGRDGLWLAQRIHAHWPKIPIVMATALDDLQNVQKSRDLGAADYIAKPITPAGLLEVVRRVTSTHALRKPEAEDQTPQDEPLRPDDKIDAEYALETPVRCPACGERVATLRAVRLIRTHVNFTSTLPRRGRVVACPHCLAIVPADLTNF
jgi:CheY-like chemotaxis protein/DNA-directed RNA polymerase subunit RPC12/RpoP